MDNARGGYFITVTVDGDTAASFGELARAAVANPERLRVLPARHSLERLSATAQEISQNRSSLSGYVGLEALSVDERANRVRVLVSGGTGRAQENFDTRFGPALVRVERTNDVALAPGSYLNITSSQGTDDVVGQVSCITGRNFTGLRCGELLNRSFDVTGTTYWGATVNYSWGREVDADCNLGDSGGPALYGTRPGASSAPRCPAFPGTTPASTSTSRTPWISSSSPGS